MCFSFFSDFSYRYNCSQEIWCRQKSRIPWENNLLQLRSILTPYTTIQTLKWDDFAPPFSGEKLQQKGNNDHNSDSEMINVSHSRCPPKTVWRDFLRMPLVGCSRTHFLWAPFRSVGCKTGVFSFLQPYLPIGPCSHDTECSFSFCGRLLCQFAYNPLTCSHRACIDNNHHY